MLMVTCCCQLCSDCEMSEQQPLDTDLAVPGSLHPVSYDRSIAQQTLPPAAT